MTTDAARLEDQLCFALYSASNRLTSIYRPILEPLNLTYTQFVVMMALWESDGISITELAERSHLGKATMTPLLKKIETKGLITMQRVVENERQKRVNLTSKGKDLASKSFEATTAAFCATGLTLAQVQTVIEACHQITAAE